MQHLKRILALLAFAVLLFACTAWAAEPNEYLKYQDPQPAAASSTFSTIAYVITLVVTFAVVIGLAYITSKFLGQKMGGQKASGDNRILYTLPLGPGKAIYMIEIAGRILVLGVTEQNINFLQEITDPVEIEKHKSLTAHVQPLNPFEQVFERQLSSLNLMSKKFPLVFKHENHDEKEGKR